MLYDCFFFSAPQLKRDPFGGPLMIGVIALIGFGVAAVSAIALRLLERRLPSFRNTGAPSLSGTELPWEKWREESYRPDGHGLIRQLRVLAVVMVASSVVGLACGAMSWWLTRPSQRAA